MIDLKQFETEHYTYEYLYTYRQWKGWGKEHFYDFCILNDKKDNHKVIRFQKRWWGLSKAMIKKGETKPRWVVYDSYNLNSQKDFPSFWSVLEKFKQGKLEEVKEMVESIDFDAGTKQLENLGIEFKKLVSKKRKTAVDNKKIEEKEKKISHLSKQVTKLNEENRKLKIESLKNNVKKYQKVITELRKNLDNKAEDESFFQEQLTQNDWIFGAWYEDVIPKRKADTENQPDFVLKRFDGFCDVVEIEAPKKELFTKPNKSGKSQPRAELVQALTQVIDYIDSYNDNYKNEFYKDAKNGVENPLNPYRPRGILIIGRDKKEERTKLRQFNSFLNHITIMTYDEFLNNAESMLDFIQSKH